MKIDLENIKEFEKQIETISNEKNVYDQRNIFLKNYISPLYKQMKSLSENEKKDLGQKLNELKE
ncbi:MAG: hypothetical protein K2J02_00385, partial [Malacoplasma sp.]|nr:hypothetical protein [Malacoplasma sp.]